MSDEDIKKVVEATIAMLPEQYASKVSNLQVMIERRPLIASQPLAGRYQATPQTERFAKLLFPDKIIIYKMPLLRISRTLDEARGHIRDTVLHELAYYFGISDQELYKIKMNMKQNPEEQS